MLRSWGWGWGCGGGWGQWSAYPSEAHSGGKVGISSTVHKSSNAPESVLLFKICSLTAAFCYGTYRLCSCPPVTLCLNTINIHPFLHLSFFQQVSFEWLYHLSNNWVIERWSSPTVKCLMIWCGDNICIYIMMMMPLLKSYESSERIFPFDRIRKGSMSKEAVSRAL